jgi:hypothetical protein
MEMCSTSLAWVEIGGLLPQEAKKQTFKPTKKILLFLLKLSINCNAFMATKI